MYKKTLIIFSSLFLFGCRTSILHKEAAKEVVNEGVKSLGNELRPVVQQSTDSLKSYLESLKISDTLNKVNELITSTTKSGDKAGELIDEVRLLSKTLNSKLNSEELINLIKTSDNTAKNIGELSSSLKELVSLIKDKASSEEFSKLKNDILKTASNIEALTNSLKDASKDSSSTSSLTKILLWAVAILLVILSTIIAIKVIKK
mgnify:CR=1 FL=1